jgi:hypothetical protein
MEHFSLSLSLVVRTHVRKLAEEGRRRGGAYGEVSATCN